MDPIIASSQITGTLPISSYIEMFTPMLLPTPEGAYTGTLPTFGFTQVFTTSAPFGATIYSWMMDQVVINIYLTVAIAFAAVIFVIGFVWRRIRMGRRYGQQQMIVMREALYRMQNKL